MKTICAIGLLLILLLPAGASAQTEIAPDAPICAACGQPITGDYVTALGKCWHPEHFVCAHCGRPFSGAAFYEHDGLPYCQACYEDLFNPRCAVCGKPIRSDYIQDAWGNTYCAEHEKELPACFSCGRLICERLTGGGIHCDDGRWICNLCRASSIDDAQTARAVLDDVAGTLGQMGFEVDAASLPLRLVDLDELKKGRARDLSGNTRTAVWTQGGKVVRREVQEILILERLPYEHFGSVAAHELGHAWLFMEEFPELPLRVEEGFCELLSYLWLEKMDTMGAAYRRRVMENNPDPIYGDGFRAALKSYRQFPLDRILDCMRRQKRFPADG